MPPIKRYRYQQAKQREAWHRLHNIGKAEDRSLQGTNTRKKNAEGQPGEHREPRREQHKKDVLARREAAPANSVL